MKKILVWSVLLMLVSGTAWAGMQRRVGELPSPEILGPTETVSIPSDGLEFRWSMTARPDYTDFRLYKGTELVEKNLILKEQVRGGKWTFRVPASTFENGGTYAWSIRLVGSRKGRSVYAIFKVKEGGAHAVQAA